MCSKVFFINGSHNVRLTVTKQQSQLISNYTGMHLLDAVNEMLELLMKSRNVFSK